jgi:hypothetical protein
MTALQHHSPNAEEVNTSSGSEVKEHPFYPRWLKYLDKLVWRVRTASQAGTLDHSSFLALLRARSLYLPLDQAVLGVAKRIAEAGGIPDAYKLARQASDAYDVTAPQGTGPRTSHPQKPRVTPEYNPDVLMRFSNNLGFQVTPSWLYQRSPLHPDALAPGAFLRFLFRPGEKVLVFDVYKSQGCQVWMHPGPDGNVNELNYLKQGCEGAWFLSNPVDGQWRDIDRLKRPGNPTGRSRRAEENVTAWRYCVIESDDAPKDQWLNALVQLPLPITSITDTGSNKGPHALVLVNATSKPHWDEIVREGIGPQLTALGADFGTMTAVRLTRLPNCRRGQTGRMQQLLYFDPAPDLRTILSKPVLWGPNDACA